MMMTLIVFVFSSMANKYATIIDFSSKHFATIEFQASNGDLIVVLFFF